MKVGRMVLADIKSLSKYYGIVKAVDDVTISIGEGEVFGLLGPNGSGKTTMIKCLTGQVRPSNGSISIMGIDVLKDPTKVRENVGIIPEQENPSSFLTAEEYLQFIAKIRGISDQKTEIDSWLKFMDCEDQRNILCKDLSRGTRQKLMFIQAFIHKPKLAFIDEPLVNLDPLSQRKIKDYLLAYAKNGNTVFLSTHDLDIAEEICTSIAIIYKGRIIYQGAPKKRLESFFLKEISRLNNNADVQKK
jgi:ABC-2 type transport system ATP-binding protein